MEKFSSSNFFQLPRGRAFTGSASSSQNFPAPPFQLLCEVPAPREVPAPSSFQLPANFSSSPWVAILPPVYILIIHQFLAYVNCW